MTTPAVFVPHLNRFMALGRIRPKSPPQVLRFACYWSAIQQPPATVDYATKAQAALARVYLNDQYGDCVIVGKYHQIGVWTGNATGTPALGQDSEVLSSYHTICGPGDNGCNIADVLDYFKSRGLSVNGQIHKIDGYVAVDNANQLEAQVALYLFGSLTLGLNLPGDWASNAHPGFVWDIPRQGSVGGHDVCVVGYTSQGVQIATWGMVGTITWRAFADKRVVEECYAQLAPDWYSNQNLAPCGVDAATLQADLQKLGGGTIPPMPDPTPPVPPTPTPPAPLPPLPPLWQWLMQMLQKLLSDLGPHLLPILEPIFVQLIETLFAHLFGKERKFQ